MWSLHTARDPEPRAHAPPPSARPNASDVTVNQGVAPRGLSYLETSAVTVGANKQSLYAGAWWIGWASDLLDLGS